MATKTDHDGCAHATHREEDYCQETRDLRSELAAKEAEIEWLTKSKAVAIRETSEALLETNEEIAAARARIEELEGALRHAREALPYQGHDGDEESGQHFEDCEACIHDAARAHIDSALSKSEPKAPEPPRCDKCGAGLDVLGGCMSKPMHPEHRDSALEEAARVAMKHRDLDCLCNVCGAATVIADEIRQLKSPPSQPKEDGK